MTSRVMQSRVGIVAVAIFAMATSAFTDPPRDKPIDFNRDVRPILSNACFACHGPDEKARKADFRLDTEEGSLAALVKGKPEESELIARVSSDDAAKHMPPKKTGKTLSPAEIDLLTRWIKQGATYQKHWAYVVPKRPDLPTVRDASRVKNSVDRFILARIDAEGMTPSPEADRYTLARRVALDLTGLPPTLAEADAFANDDATDAYERFVDRMLAKPTYGEHAARLWLDLARYADSAGYADDPPRTIWAFRDYVIKSFNRNKPFDQFTVEQIAGDLLPNPTEEQLVATAFHRNTMTNNEGGTNDEEFRNVAVVDRVNTTLMVWMGTSMACAQCHTHKYDPITQKEYFQVFAILNNTADADRNDESPLHTLADPVLEKRRAGWETELAGIEAAIAKRLTTVAQALTTPASSRTKAQTTAVADFHARKEAAEVKTERDRLAALQAMLAAQKPATVPVMRELVGKERRKTRLQIRGNYLDVADEVTEGVPAAFHPLPADAPRNRLTLAKWLVAPENPLTARVIANRYWEQLFGMGLVRSSEEFGAQGERPSHPELLDWLATELVRLKWDMKAFLKLLVTSATYRQSSKVTKESFERDADNRLLSRGPRLRLTAEMVRDQALFAGGLLSEKMYGPSVKPPQPELGIKAAFGGAIDWKTSDGEDRYRRGVYTTWRRSNPYPSMSTFDAPNRDICVVRRGHTNTPLQALVTLNDSVGIEAAQALARRTVAEGGTDVTDKARYAFRRCLTRPAQDEEVRRLAALYEESKASYAKDPAKATQMATVPLGPVPAGMDAADLAAWTVVANVLMNLDEAADEGSVGERRSVAATWKLQPRRADAATLAGEVFA
ncbi:MAG: PSD1 and planctomycete cytochrome C domain-containing protein [Gemmataceae bacterium]